MQFVRLKKEKSLGWELAFILVCKVVAIALIFFVFFGPDTQIQQNADSVSNGILHPVVKQDNFKGEK